MLERWQLIVARVMPRAENEGKPPLAGASLTFTMIPCIYFTWERSSRTRAIFWVLPYLSVVLNRVVQC